MVVVRSALVLVIALLLLWFILGVRLSLELSNWSANDPFFWRNLALFTVPPAAQAVLSAAMLWTATRSSVTNARPSATGSAAVVLVLFVGLPLLYGAIAYWSILTGACNGQRECSGPSGLFGLLPMITLVPTLAAACLLWLGIGRGTSQRGAG